MKKLLLLILITPIIGNSQIQQNGNDIYYLNGNFGLGTDSPQLLDYSHPTTTLTLENTANSIEFLGNRANTLESLGWLIFFNDENRALDFVVVRDDSGNSGNLKIRTNDGMGGTTPSNMKDRLNLLSNGNLGIGDSEPSEKMVVNGNLLIKGDNALILTSPNGTKYEIKVDNNGNLYSSQSLATNSQLKKNRPTLYPNPTSSLLALNSDKEYDIEVYDMAGNKVMALTGNTIDMSHLSSATYIVKALDKVENEEVSYKVVKN